LPKGREKTDKKAVYDAVMIKGPVFCSKKAFLLSAVSILIYLAKLIAVKT
jgi:hypothetical protein